MAGDGERKGKAMEKRDANRGSPSLGTAVVLPPQHQKKSHHEEKAAAATTATATATARTTLGKKRPRRSASSSQKNYREIENFTDDKHIDADQDYKIAASASSLKPKTIIKTTTTRQKIELGGNDPFSVAANSHDRLDKDTDVPIVKAAVGVSLPWFETGGSLYRRPPSLLWDTPKDADWSRKGERKWKRKGHQEKKSSVVKQHFCGLPILTKRLGVCAECGIDENGDGKVAGEMEGNNRNVVVLCDGPSCDREFHLKCCRPPLQEVPKGDFYCFDCHPNGGYAVTLLEDYLDETEVNRDAHNDELLLQEATPNSNETHSPYNRNIPLTAPNKRARRVVGKKGCSPTTNNSLINSSRKRTSISLSDNFTFVDKLLFEDMEENQSEFLSQLMNGICSEAPLGPPRSELEFFHRNKDKDSLLVGCAFRLYCPKTNHYQTGRILQIREQPPSSKTNQSNATNNSLEDYDRNQDTECLVRFPAGRDYRKKSVTRWIRLEEHSLAVACPHLVWGKFASSELEASSSSPPDSKKTKKISSLKERWVPTKLWMRSSRELVMSMQLLNESLGQISYRNFRQHMSSSSSANTVNAVGTDVGTILSNRSQRSSPQQKDGRSHPIGLVNGDNDVHDSVIKGAAPSSDNKSSSESKPYLQQEWILAECIGRKIYKLVHVSTETKEYCYKNGSALSKTQKRVGENGGTNKRSTKKATSTTNITQHLSSKPRENEIMFALVEAEEEERNRVLSWNKLPLRNAWHTKALTSLDEHSLGPLSYDDSYNQTNLYGASGFTDGICGEEEEKDENSNQKTVSIEPTPLIRTGLDRMYILEQFVTHFNKTQETNGITTGDDMLRGTKDLAMSLSSELVSNHSITACIQQQNRMARLRQSMLLEGSISSPELGADVNYTKYCARLVGENSKFVQELSDEKDIQFDENTKTDAAREQSTTIETIALKEKCRSPIVVHKSPRSSHLQNTTNSLAAFASGASRGVIWSCRQRSRNDSNMNPSDVAEEIQSENNRGRQLQKIPAVLARPLDTKQPPLSDRAFKKRCRTSEHPPELKPPELKQSPTVNICNSNSDIESDSDKRKTQPLMRRRRLRKSNVVSLRQRPLEQEQTRPVGLYHSNSDTESDSDEGKRRQSGRRRKTRKEFRKSKSKSFRKKISLENLEKGVSLYPNSHLLATTSPARDQSDNENVWGNGIVKSQWQRKDEGHVRTTSPAQDRSDDGNDNVLWGIDIISSRSINLQEEENDSTSVPSVKSSTCVAKTTQKTKGSKIFPGTSLMQRNDQQGQNEDQFPWRSEKDQESTSVLSTSVPASL